MLNKFRHVIKIINPTSELDEFGHRVEGTDKEIVCAAEVRPMGSNERVSAYQMQSGQTHVVTTHFQPALKEVTGEWRMELDGRRLNIVGIPRNVGERNEFFVFDVSEGGTDGH